MRYLLLFLLPLSLYGSQILSYNIYERTDRADVMITFDTPFSGVIKQSKGKNRITIKLEGASIEGSKVRKVNSNYLRSLVITPLKNQTQIVATVSLDAMLIASKTSDGYGLRLRFTKKRPHKTQASTSLVNGEKDLSGLPTKKDMGISTSYYIVVGILIFGIITLLVLKKKISKTNPQNQQNSWLFNSNTQPQETTTTAPQSVPKAETHNTQNSAVTIRFQKSLNNTNSVVMLDFGNESYLVLMGNSNILLDKFRDNKPTTQQEFNTILQERNQELEDFLGSTGTQQHTNNTQESLQAYKERAASLIYNDEP